MNATVESMADKKVIERFACLMKSDCLAHAYLFVGPEGSGKVETSLAIAQLVNCESVGQKPCGKCSSCLKVASGNHPDILLCDRGDDQSIKIQKVRNVIERLQLHPYEARRKVVIIKDIDVMTTESSNAFLKTLEEPTASSLLLLTTANPERILATVKSRCHHVHFFGLSRQGLSARLQEHIGVSLMQADVVSGFSEGCYGKARRFQEEDFVDRKNEIIDQFLFKDVDDALLKSILSDKETTKQTLNVLLFCFKDLLLLKAGAPQKNITNGDRVKDLTAWASRYSLDQLRDILAEVVNTKKMLDANFNIKVPLMLLKEKIWIRS